MRCWRSETNHLLDGSAYRETEKHHSLFPKGMTAVTGTRGTETLNNEGLQVTTLP